MKTTVLTLSSLVLLPLMAASLWGAPAKPQASTFAVEGIRCGACVPPLQSALEAVSGVEKVSVDAKTKRATVKYAPGKADVQQLAAAAARTKNAHGEPFALALVLDLKPTSGDASPDRAAKALRAVAGVKEAKVDAKGRYATVKFAPKGNATQKQLAAALGASGYRVVAPAAHGQQTGTAGTAHQYGFGGRTGGGGCCG